jgi:long-chain fatty acid transport protein
MSYRSRFTLTALTLVVAGAFAPQAQASGFQLREQSPSAQGTGFAGVSAGGSDISVMFFNPAAMTQFSGWQFSGGGSLVAPSAEFSNGKATRVTTDPISGPTSHGNAAVSAVLPNLNIMYSVSNDLKLGLGVNVPFGLTTEYDSNWMGRYHGLKSELKTIDITPTIAYRINPQWSVGAAFVARKADATLTNAVDFGLISLGVHAANPAFPLLVPGAYDGTAKLTGDTWGYGFKLGAIFQPSDALRVGMAYHGAMKMTLKGNVTFTYPALPAPVVAGFQQAGFHDGGGEADLKLPATYSIGFNYDLSQTVAIQGEVARSTWSKFDELRVKFTSNVPPQPVDSNTVENWKDTTFIALGATCKVAAWTYRVGLSHDTGGVDDANRTPRIPDADRTWVSLGAGYAFSKAMSVDVAYSHLFIKDSTVGLTTTASTADPNFTRGNLSGSYKMNINIIGVNLRYSF